jgi:hypothetical protein
MREQFIEKNFSPASQTMLIRMNEILSDYAAQGYRLSVRQLYYQLVARAAIENSQRSYKCIVDLVSNARLAGFLDWNMIEDRGRETITPPMWESPAQIVKAAAAQFAIDRWADQDNHIEVMVEKAALEGILIPVCREEGVRFTANRGYSSQSMMYEAGKRIEQMIDAGKNVFVLYLGDHDPSGIDMTRDVRDRLEMFSRSSIEVERLALNWEQVEQWQPPENPAKSTDSRYVQYVELYGESSWELDAVDPSTLGSLVRKAISRLRDDILYEAALERESGMRSELEKFAAIYRKNGKHKKG